MQLENVNNLRYIFDLKGSTEDRKVKGKTKPSTTLKDQNFNVCFNHQANKSMLKGNFVEFSLRDKFRLRGALQADVDFLRSQNLMDYSLLLAIEQLPNRKPSVESNRRRNTQAGRFEIDIDEEDTKIQRTTTFNNDCQLSAPQFGNLEPETFMNIFREKHCFTQENRIYHIAIIDYLQEWNLAKKTERFIKTTFMGKNGAQLSAIEPGAYAKRFKQFVDSKVLI